MKRKKIIGYVGVILVIAYEYPGDDKGLSYYTMGGTIYMGTVVFTRIISEVYQPY